MKVPRDAVHECCMLTKDTMSAEKCDLEDWMQVLDEEIPSAPAASPLMESLTELEQQLAALRPSQSEQNVRILDCISVHLRSSTHLHTPAHFNFRTSTPAHLHISTPRQLHTSTTAPLHIYLRSPRDKERGRKGCPRRPAHGTMPGR